MLQPGRNLPVTGENFRYLLLCRENGILFIKIHQLDMILRVQKGLVVILPVNVRQLFTDLVEIRQGDDFAVDFAQVLAGCRCV